MKKKIIIAIIMVLLLNVSLIPDKVYAEELEIEDVVLEITVSFASEEEFREYVYETFGISIIPANLSKVNGSITMNKSETAVGVTISVQSVGGYADEVGFKNISLRVYATGSLAYSTFAVDDFYENDSFTCAGGFSVTNPKSGYSYQVAGTFYTIIKGVEYTYSVVSSKLTY